MIQVSITLEGNDQTPTSHSHTYTIALSCYFEKQMILNNLKNCNIISFSILKKSTLAV